MRLVIKLREIDCEIVSIKNLKSDYTPIELASQLNDLINQGLIEMDWINKTIIKKDVSLINILKHKNEISRYERNIPNNLKQDQVEINKPYLSKSK